MSEIADIKGNVFLWWNGLILLNYMKAFIVAKTEYIYIFFFCVCVFCFFVFLGAFCHQFHLENWSCLTFVSGFSLLELLQEFRV